MNLVLDDAEELSLKQKTRKPLGALRRRHTLRHRRRRRHRHAAAAAAAAAASATARTRNSAEHPRPALAQGGSCSKATTSR